ncbi:hypothetical protein GCM10025867_48500 (plasmid) [Frondihabitans sucicola]|uniref:Uncharacterized protein n=1 Tax=Frondihabitans sucicola TaxID=1268041 RepID=A0ABN6Y5M9_9MICO|nr:hypothetical protein [Frondihabitans sucicola]BDZ52609.1 hypothetical protein GCM10025867_48500 [Frondihabitans sucicola]
MDNRTTQDGNPALPGVERRPLWLIDVTDTLTSASGAGRRGRNGWADWKSVAVDAITGSTEVLYSPSVTALVHEALASGLDVCALDWEPDYAARLLDALALPRLPIVEPGSHSDPREAKLQAARGLAMNRPLLWTDSEVGAHAAVTKWLRHRRSPSYLMAPSNDLSLSPSMVGVVRTWIGTHAPSAIAGKASS